MVNVTFEHVYKTFPAERTTKLTAFQEFVCTVIKLSINPPIQDLGYRFGVSISTVSRILLKWLGQMDICSRDLIHWPDREALQKTMPVCFQELFGKKVAIIIDCFKVIIERPSSLEARGLITSTKTLLKSYWGSNLKVLFHLCGGRVSDKHLIETCGILRKLLPGDVMLADRGFDIS